MWCDYEVVESTNYLFENHNYSPKKTFFTEETILDSKLRYICLVLPQSTTLDYRRNII